MVTTTTNVHGTEVAQLAIFIAEAGASSDFAVFKYGTEADLTNVFLTPEQVAALAAQFAEAAARFSAVPQEDSRKAADADRGGPDSAEQGPQDRR